MLLNVKRSLEGVFTDDQRFGWFLAIMAAPLAMMRGAVLPGVWVLTQASMNYSQGFAKRGLRGALLDTLGIHHKLPLTLWMFAELAAFFGLAVLFTLRPRLAEKAGGSIVVSVIAASFIVTGMTYLIGYPDVVLCSLSICLLLVAHARNRFLLAIPLCAVAMLIHESFLVLYLPLILFTFLVDSLTTAPSKKKILAIYAALLTCMCVGFGFATSLHATLTPAHIIAWRTDMVAKSNFAPEPFFSEILGWSMKDNIRYSVAFALKRPQGFILNGFYSIPISVYLFFLLKRLLTYVNIRNGNRILLGFCGISAAPLLMVILGTDIMRWATASALVSYLALGFVCYRLPISVNRLDKFLYNASLALLVFELSLTRYGGLLAPIFSRIG